MIVVDRPVFSWDAIDWSISVYAIEGGKVNMPSFQKSVYKENEIEGLTGFKVGLIFDDVLRLAANESEQNYWYIYTREIAEQLGFRICDVSPKQVEDKSVLIEYCVLFVGGGIDQKLSQTAKDYLSQWIQSGGILIGFMPESLDVVFGIEEAGYIEQSPDDYTISGYFNVLDDGIGKGVHSETSPEDKLLIFSDIRVPSVIEAVPLGYLFIPDICSRNAISSGPAITERSFGTGKAYYFSFDVPKTIWLLHQGRPVMRDMDGDGWLRTMDMTIIGNGPGREKYTDVLYADEIEFLIQKMMSHHPLPFIHQIPPFDGRVADSFCHWAGDDEADSEGVQVKASDFMHALGLPYQINAMSLNGSFPLSVDEIQHIEGNGHQFALHYNFIDGFSPGDGITEEDVQEQAQAFREHFGKTPICSVPHWGRWYGWIEPAVWMKKQGQLGSQDMFSTGYPPSNPKNVVSFAFGTALPYYFYHSYEDGNARLDYVEVPFNAHEIGRTADESRVDFNTVKKAIDIASKYQVPMSMFFHPIYVVTSRNCQRGIEAVLRYIEDENLLVKHMTTGDAILWWKDRSQSSVRDISRVSVQVSSVSGTINEECTSVEEDTMLNLQDKCLSFSSMVVHEDGIVVKIPISERTVRSVSSDDGALYYQVKKVLGLEWLFFVIPQGIHNVVVRWER